MYYIYFLDGDNWGQLDIWKNNTFVWKYDFQTSYDFFCIPKYKDCIVQWSDEFIIISAVDIQKKLDQVIDSKPFTMTKLKYKSDYMTFQTVARLSNLVRNKKEILKGVWYQIENKELEVKDSGN